MFERIVVCHQTVEIGRLQWSASGQQHHERYLLERADDGCNQVEQQGRCDHGQRDTEKLSCRTRPIQRRGLVNLSRNIFHVRVENQHHRSDAKRTGKDHGKQRPRRIYQPVWPFDSDQRQQIV